MSADHATNTLAVRNRQISPAFWTSDDVCDLPSDAHRLMFIGLWAAADREGRLRDEPGRIGRRVRPWDSKGAAALINELVRCRMVQRYEVDGQRCLCIPSFKKWQRVHPHEARSHLPAPPGGGDQQAVLADVVECDDIENTDKIMAKQAGDRIDVIECKPEPSEPSEPSENLSVRRKKRARTAKPVDPRHAPLVADLVAIAPGYAFDGRDARAVTELLAKGDPPEVATRWRRARQRDGYPLVRTLSELNTHWNHFATDSPTKAGAPTNGIINNHDGAITAEEASF